MLSGKPSRSRGPGNSSRKKSASWASNERKPFGTILTGWLSEVGVAGVVEGVPEEPAATEGDSNGTTGWGAGGASALAHWGGRRVDGLLGQEMPQILGQVLRRREAFRSALRQGLQADAFQL